MFGHLTFWQKNGISDRIALDIVAIEEKDIYQYKENIIKIETTGPVVETFLLKILFGGTLPEKWIVDLVTLKILNDEHTFIIWHSERGASLVEK